MLLRILFILTIYLSILPVSVWSQEKEPDARIAFYNAENFFDATPDSTINYSEFNPDGTRHWTKQRYKHKLQHIYKVVAALGQWKGLAIMGFSEIENRNVLHDLTQNTPLKSFHYKIIHYDSPDKRGIDVGLIYQPALFKPLFSKAIPVTNPNDSLFRTRDILYVKGLLMNDTLHLFINHWPSRYSGLLNTQPKRLQAARTLKVYLDSICKHQPNAEILVIGDMNENPDDKAIQSLIHNTDTCKLTALEARPVFGLAKGSIKSKAQWAVFDQMLVNKSFTKNQGALYVQGKSFYIFDAQFLLEQDVKNMGLKPNRSFVGFKYHGGFSDHLPVYVDICKHNHQQP